MAQSVVWSHETVLAAEPGSAAKARGFVLEHLVEHRLLYLVDHVRLVASELAANAVVHARTAFTVTLEGRLQLVLLAVRDGSSARPQPPADILPGAAATSGRGLFLVSMFSESWGVTVREDDTKSVWASFDIRVGPIGEPAGRTEQT
jgi:anti-sigma regulatory factor (Ser/Thr protein kinase)